MKFSDILGMASGGMWRNKTRTILTIVAIFVAGFTITLTTAIGAGVSNYIDKQTAGFGAEDALVITVASDSTSTGPVVYNPNSVNQFGQSFNAITTEDIAKIEKIDGVTKVTPFETSSPSFIQTSGDKFILSSQQLVAGQNLDIIAGSQPKNGEAAQIVITPEYVTALGFKNDADAVGSKVTLGVLNPLKEIEEVTATVSGVMNDSLLAAGRLYVNDTLQSKVTTIVQQGLPSTVTESFFAAVATMDSTDTATVDLIKADLTKEGFSGQTIADQIGVVKQVFDAITIVLTAFGVIALIAASFGVINTLYMSVQDRTKEIGLMKASGLSSGRVFAVFSFEAALLGFWGSVVGLLGAWGVGSIVNQIASTTFLKNLPGFTLMQFPLPSVIGIVVLIMTITFLAGALPARRAAKLNPIDALRYE